MYLKLTIQGEKRMATYVLTTKPSGTTRRYLHHHNRGYKWGRLNGAYGFSLSEILGANDFFRNENQPLLTPTSAFEATEDIGSTGKYWSRTSDFIPFEKLVKKAKEES